MRPDAALSETGVLLAERTLPLALETLSTRYAYATFAILFAIGLYMMIASPNLVKKVIGLNLFQSAIFLFFVAMAYVRGGSVPVIPSEGGAVGEYASPLPQVIVLTAIVVGVSLTAVALALIVRLYTEYGTLNEATIREVMDE
ncbi:Mrp-type sodium/proton antiporter system subunit C [Natronomonas moolapensis 8.8.11]|uniref:Mrp-type sodium/proton antiporter system subunit C n=1 Tax=Natronomonas moolapensis (strain DSM 18674 / CECT 7526 / JCM 14361 / 8.8.11) TaxID=268739 RepID=M1XNV6_NATM8|nr:Mrp-type sodium/proton antiporter system subunit C [Natronomonas moolapensis 8.8.11]